MHKHIAEDWVKALRSGKYKQTQGRLKDHNGYCCLGVLTDMLGYSCDREPDAPEILSYRVAKFCGIYNLDPSVSNSETANVDALSALNDSGATFEEIADLIEKNWEQL